MFKHEVLENTNRQKIYRVIEENPGIHLREIQRLLDMPLSTVDYHLNYLASKQIILRDPIQDNARRLIRYYTKPFDEEDKRVMAALRQKRMREIVFFMLLNSNVRFSILMKQLNIPRSTLSFYLNYLVRRGILERERTGYEHVYTLKLKDRVEKIIIAYRSSFVDKLVDKAMSLWLDTKFHKNN
jgi:predicted transcriptional regulator